ncbi:MAG: DUF2207 domain-containing protein [Anaerolineae bacterium]|nr:DUF2207 domain-containing protein [Anaerolineae bacterium]
MRRRWTWVVIAFLLLLGLAAGISQAQEKDLYWDRFDVDITILPNGDFQVVEYQQIVFIGGTFSQGYRSIPLDRVERITNVEVWEGDIPYAQSRSNQPGTYEVLEENGQLVVNWYFEPTANASRAWALRYTVQGGLRIYEGGDQLYWKAIYEDRSKPVRAATVTVHLPAALSEDQLVVASYGSDAVWELKDPQTVVFTATREIPAYSGLEVRVQFPHGIVSAQKPSWQAADDRRIEYEERWAPLFSLLVGAFSLLLLVGGGVGLYLLWFTKGRDKPVELVAEYINEPPSDLPPGLAGTLLDERADMADIVATIVDLARRGIISIEEIEEPGLLGIGKKKDFRYRLLKSPQGLLEYEKALIKGLFGRKQERRLSELKEKFYTHIPTIQKGLYKELVRQGLYSRDPDSVRGSFAGLGVAGVVIAAIVGIFITPFLIQYVASFPCIPVALGMLSVALIVVSRFMPARTEKGSEEYARWKAFKRYLENIEKYEKIKEAADLFDKYLPYAIAFGLEKSWIDKFAAVEAPAPPWYIPARPYVGDTLRPVSSRPSGGAVPGGGGISGPASARPGGTPSLDSLSSGMFHSLSSMSSGLFSMLNSASSTLSSASRSSGGSFGGGGGFSGGGGGGFSGGGGGGGGFR